LQQTYIPMAKADLTKKGSWLSIRDIMPVLRQHLGYNLKLFRYDETGKSIEEHIAHEGQASDLGFVVIHKQGRSHYNLLKGMRQDNARTNVVG